MKALRLCITLLAFCGNSALASQTYSLVQGIDKFDGSAVAWGLLETNGFAVSDPGYKQIFEPYLDTSLPPFITTDSAWETYQVLLAASAKPIETQKPPDADFFSGTIAAKIPTGAAPSGLDFFVTNPELRSPAATRALRLASGDSVEKALENLNYPLPSNSLATQTLRLLATLQKSGPGQRPSVFDSEAWADEQLWTQLGGWIGQSLRRQFHLGAPGSYTPAEDAPGIGAVAPYPEFFAGLAKLSRETESAMEKAGLDERFDSKAVAQKLLEGIFVQQSLTGDNQDEMANKSAERVQYDQFAGHYMETHHAGGGENSPAADQMQKDLEAVARRGVAGGVLSGEDQAILQSFFDERMTAPRLLRDFAVTCDKLSELARKQADGTPFTDADEKWIAGYGLALARYHFFPDPAAEEAEQNSTAIRRFGTNNTRASVLSAGLGKPETLYIILPANGRLRLFRGAVLSYRESARSGSSAPEGKPSPPPDHPENFPAPAFTASFRAGKTAAEMLATLVAEASGGQGDHDTQETLDLLQTRVGNGDLPALIKALSKADDTRLGNPVAGGIAAAIAKLNWRPFEKDLVALMEKEEGIYAGDVASILSQRPEWLDGAFLSANFDHRPPRSRRVYAFLLGLAPPTVQTRAALLGALHDEAPAVRWQAVVALGNAPWDAPQKIPAVLARLNDTNEFVVAAAARSLGRIGAGEAAPVLFSNLEQRIAAPAPRPTALQEQHAAVQDFILGIDTGQPNPFDPENLLGRAHLGRMRRFGADVRHESFNAIAGLIEALGDLHYQPATDAILGLLDGHNATAAAKALKKLAPEKLAGRLLDIASDKNAPPQARDDALLLLTDNAGASAMPRLIPLLDDRAVLPGVRVMPGREWRICDRAATTLAALLGRAVHIEPVMPTEQRDDQIEQVRQWLKSAY